jgi:hypothetical protein
LSESGFPGFKDFQDGVVGGCYDSFYQNQDFQDLRIFRMGLLVGVIILKRIIIFKILTHHKK